MKADEKTESEVRAALEELTGAYHERDAERLMALIAPDADVVLYGTGADEKRLGPDGVRAQAERDWSQTEEITMRFAPAAVSARGDVAWAATDGAFDCRVEGQDISIPARATFVLEKRDGRWLFVQSHFSMPAAGQEEGDSV